MHHVLDLPLNRCKRNSNITCDITEKNWLYYGLFGIYTDLNTVVMETHKVTVNAFAALMLT